MAESNSSNENRESKILLLRVGVRFGKILMELASFHNSMIPLEVKF